jgi:diguanylate cyclase (GGDEF)-like protein
MPEILSPEQALRLIDSCPIPLILLSPEGVIRACNPAFVTLVGKAQADELTGQSAGTLANPSLKTLLGNGKQAVWTDSNGQQRHYEVLHGDTGGENPLEVRYFIDVSRQHALREELHENTLTDSVTGLLNQRGVMLALEPQVARSRRYNSPISVITLDVHSASDDDALRKQVARQLKDQLRWADLIGCDDKQAFVLVLPETGEEAALQLAEKLSARLVEFARSEYPEQALSTVYGVTGWRRTDNATTLLKRARLALEQTRVGQDHEPVAL